MDGKVLAQLTEINKELKSLKNDMTELKSLKLDINEIKSLKLDMKELKSLKLDMKELKTEMHNRFDKVEAKLEGVGGQFEITNDSRIDDFDFVADKVRRINKSDIH